jgi:hypothetical protein
MTIGVVVLVTCMPFSIVRNPFGGPRIAMTALGSTSTLGFWNSEGYRRLELGATPKGAAVHVLGREGKSRLALSTIEKDGKDIPVLLIYDATNPQASFQVDMLNGGRPELVMTSPFGKGRIDLTFLPNGDPVLRLLGKDGTVMFETPHPDDSVMPSVEPGD